jgi:DNA-directed RNA polymerase subunit B
MRRGKSKITDLNKVSIIYDPADNGTVKINTAIGRMYFLRPIVYRLPYSEALNERSSQPMFPVDRKTGEEITDKKDLSDWDKKCLDAGQVQWTRLQAQHVADLKSGKMNMSDLIRKGVIEYVCADECTNIMYAYDIEEFIRNCHGKNGYKNPYTHISMPHETLSLLLMGAGHGCKTQQLRSSYFKKFVPQGGCIMPDNIESNVSSKRISVNSYRRANESLTTDKFIQSTASPTLNMIKASPNNQEDSWKISNASLSKFEYIMIGVASTTCKENQSIQKPSKSKHHDGVRKMNDHLNDKGEPYIGAVVRKGEAFIGKLESVQNTKGGKVEKASVRKRDISIINEKSRDAVVINTFFNERKQNTSTKSIKVPYYREYPLRVGDKCATVAGCKAVISEIEDYTYMAVDERGVFADAELNITAIPTRMPPGQTYCQTAGTIGISNGIVCSSAYFDKYDWDVMDALAEKTNVNKNGEYIMTSGITGNEFVKPMAFGILDIMRLDKIGADQALVTKTTIRDLKHGQPKKGVGKKGGLTYGLQEAQALVAHQSRALWEEIMLRSCDGGYITYCTTCNSIADTPMNEDTNFFQCSNRKCKDPVFARVYGRFSTTYMNQTKNCVGIDTKYHVIQPDLMNMVYA